jgi:hypothetical protein
MIGGLSIWTFSPVDFHVRMAQLLIFLMITNAITGVVILPSFISAFRPWFIRRYVPTNGVSAGHQHDAAASTGGGGA